MEIKAYDKLPKEAKDIRREVFVDEQGFKNEFDDIDNTAIHLVCYDKEKPIGTARIFYDEELKGYHFGRIAVIKSYRGKGIGRELLNFAEKIVKEKGGSSLSLSAQERVSGFYFKQGYEKQGEPYLDEYCPHIFMTKNL